MAAEKTCINHYILDEPLHSDNSGFSKWGIGVRDGVRYFVKEFLSPAYPANDSVYSEEKKIRKIQQCQSFINERKALYLAVRDADDGNLVPVMQFFRIDAKYYISTAAIAGPFLSIAAIAAHSFAEKLYLCCTVAHAIASIHEKHIVHADIKPDNILVISRDEHIMLPHVIDFDCSFFESMSPKLGEELHGDMVYLSPEGFLHIAKIESNLSCKMDVFALGLLFFQYMTGKLPEFDTETYQYAYESVLDAQGLGLDEIKNPLCRDLFQRMLAQDPDMRPDMQSVFHTLHTLFADVMGIPTICASANPPIKSPPPEPEKNPASHSDANDFLVPAGDL